MLESDAPRSHVLQAYSSLLLLRGSGPFKRRDVEGERSQGACPGRCSWHLYLFILSPRCQGVDSFLSTCKFTKCQMYAYGYPSLLVGILTK